MIIKEERIGSQRLILGDSTLIVPTLEKPDAILMDPPYGLGKRMQGGTWGAQDHNSGFLRWDLEARQEWVDMVLAFGVPTIIWGGNYFAVPPTRCWLIWSKVNAVPTMADAELAWTNLDRPAKRLDLPVGRVEYGHPTQKPLALFQWCLSHVPAATTILDPYLGSGTTLVACQKMGKQGTGIELDPDYFQIACDRVHKAWREPDMLVEIEPQPVQQSLL